MNILNILFPAKATLLSTEAAIQEFVQHTLRHHPEACEHQRAFISERAHAYIGMNLTAEAVKERAERLARMLRNKQSFAYAQWYMRRAAQRAA